MIRKCVGKVDILVTEGTMVSRLSEESSNPIRTEDDLGKRAGEIFREHNENVVLVSSTNLDSVMEFYLATPEDKVFLCDPYQARVMKTAIEAKNKYYPERYRFSKQIYVLCPGEYDGYMKDLLQYRVPNTDRRPFGLANLETYLNKGFVMLARPCRNPNLDVGRFEERMQSMKDPFIIYSLWTGYLRGGKAEDPAIVRFLSNYMDKEHMEVLHTSGHAYVETLKKLMDMTDPDVIIPMHTDDSKAFETLEIFKEYWKRIRRINDNEVYTV